MFVPMANGCTVTFLQWTPLITLQDLEKEALRQAILHHSGNLAAAADDLDISVNTVYRKFNTLFTEAERQQIKPKNEWWK